MDPDRVMVLWSYARVHGDLQRTVSVHGGLREQFRRLDTNALV
jgi:hypothetical protein